MVAVNSRIKVIPSKDLAEMHLSGIVGRTGKVAEQVFGSNGNLIGYMVCLSKSFQGECLWFIPKNAAADAKDTD